MSEKRTFLFLQGPSSPFFERLALRLIARGHSVVRINICFGDRVFWRALPALNYRGKIEDWRAYVRKVMEDNDVTDVLLLGDRRPHHRIAGEEARARDALVICVELGYIRPDWLTVERNGMSTYSHFPNDPKSILEIAEKLPIPELTERFGTSFLKLAYWDVLYNFSNVFLWPFHPHYKWHAIYHPMAEYVGWLNRLLVGRSLKRKRQAALRRVYDSDAPWYLFPLQLATDYQLRDHSPFVDQRAPIEAVIKSFAANAPPESHLVFKVHPLDNRLEDWNRFIDKTAAEHGAGERVYCIEGGKLNKLVMLCRGIVTINSTVGTTALILRKPVYVLGTAIFDIEGLTYQGPLDRFWTEAPAPDGILADAFIRAVAGTIQIKGGFYDDQAIAIAIDTLVPRLERRLINEPGGFVDPPPRASGPKTAMAGGKVPEE